MRVFATLLCLGLIAGGGYQWMQSGVDTTLWPSVEGRILNTSSTTFGGTRRTGQGSTYGLTVHYEYWVSGVRYEGSRATLLGGHVLTTPSRQEVRDVQRFEYRIGDPVTVYYDPGRPSRAVLIPQARQSKLPGLIMILFAAGMLVFLRRAARQG